MNVIETYNLCKYFKEKKAVDELNLEVPQGVIFGYLGPNGAGKTTTIRLLLNLAKPTKGYALVLGEDITKSKNYLKKIGFLPDVPNFYNYLTAREYLDFLSDILNINKKRIDEVLEIVGLKNEKKRIGTFSRGMRQRLGIAQALLHDPILLILDEPTSALDPQGRKEVLDLILSLKGEKTIFFSTHILADVERICDSVGIIKEGKLLLNDTIENLKKRYSSRTLYVEVNNCEKLFNKLKLLPWIESLTFLNKNGIIIKVKDMLISQKEIPKIISQEDLSLLKFEFLEPSLEDIFIEVVS
ncbi:MAG: ABC transporter ATP-binding protein [Dictyoglomus sp.]|nr:ABC transporter ATP-binding protein [Dictyoglomus sp.]MCX7942127.1 ABC transporter ATP-binding protein [Dictyoglomaceae bacterium]MDW8188014.1 ABC transporter ATP-binding protein [Dictyoglomus sp.]